MDSRQFPKWPVWVAKITAGMVVSTGLYVLAGWIFDVATLKRVFPGWVKMAPSTALCFVLVGMALWCAAGGGWPGRRLTSISAQLARIGAAVVVFLGLLELTAYLAGWNLGIEHLYFFREPANAREPARMAPATASAFALAGTALLLAGKTRFGLFQWLVFFGGFVGWLGVSNYLFGGEPLFHFRYIMAPHASMAFVLLNTGILCSRTDGGLMALLVSDGPGGVMARRLVPSAIIVPIVLGWLRLQGQRTGWYGLEAGTALFALGNILVFGALIWASARLLQTTDAQRKKSAQALREYQELLQSIINNSTTVIYVKDLAGHYLLVNRQFEALFHRTQAELLGKTDFDLFTREQAAAFRVVDQRVAASDQVVVAEEVAPLDDGLHTYISVKFPLRDQSGKPYAVGGVSTDITERKRADMAIRESEERTRLIVNTALDAVITTDGEGVVTGWNPQAEVIFGWSGQDMVGRSLKETIIPVAHREAHERGLQHYRDNGGGAVFQKRIEMTALHRQGHEFPIELAITPMRLGGRIFFSAFVRDITERKQAEQKLRTQLARLDLLGRTTRAIGERQDLPSIFQAVIRSLEDHLPVDFGCVCHYDALANTLTVTSVGIKSLPLALELAMSEQARIPIDQNGLSRCVHGQLVYEPDLSEVAFPFPQRLARGNLRALVAAPLLAEGKVFGVLMVGRRTGHSFSSTDCEFLRQLSEHVGLAAQQSQLYATLQRAYEDLRQTQQAVLQQERLRALGQMASGIAHDINNAISPVTIYAEMLLEHESGLSPEGREELKTIQRAIEDVAATVSRMREFYRERGPQLTLAEVELNRLVEQVVNLTRARWSDMPQQRGIVIRMQTELAAGLPLIMGVESEIREALTNLVFNAVDAMPAGGTLTLRTRATLGQAASGGKPSRPPKVQVEVSDTGVGMDEETRRRCLEPFFTTKGERGTGLGLAMVYGMVQRHSAELEIESTVGGGTTMRLNFAPATAEGGVTESGTAPIMPPRVNILIVDDDPVLLKSLCAVLEKDGHHVVAANGGQEGIDVFRTAVLRGTVFAVVFTDLGMPHVDGRQVAEAIKAASPATPVVLLTGWGQRLVAGDDLPPHVDRVLGKPPKLSEIRETLAHFCTPA